MLRTIRRLALIASSGAALLALYVPAAQGAQAATATTLPASKVTIMSAVLNGMVDTGGQATEWQFQYGTSTSYGQKTPLSDIPAGQGNVHVSAPITGLTPNMTYHFRLLAISGIGTNYVETDYGADLTFKTLPTNGKLLLVSKKLIVSKGLVTVALKCTSKLACAGSYSIDTDAALAQTHKVGTVVCATKSFKVPAGKTRNVKASVRSACLSLLRSAKHHKIKGTFTSAPSTAQLGLTKAVTLTLL